MTEEKRIEWLLELQEHPERLTDEQLQQILADDEMRQLVQQLGFAKRAFKHDELKSDTPDVDAEWEKFAASHANELTNVARAEGKLACTMPCKEEEDERQIEALYKQMYRAMIAKDIEALGTLLDENSVLIHMTGTRQPKREYLRAIKDGTLNYYSVEDEEIIIEVNGDKATMTGRSRVNAAVYGGGRHTWRLQIKSTLVKKDGRWLFVEQRVSTY